ncbi:hypothetical protein SGLAM104S_00128 [Streptomyces glaucescens]
MQDWIYRFDPDNDSRGWEFWDVIPVGPSRVRVWVDSWGESFFGSLELLWLLYTQAAHMSRDGGPSGERLGVRGARPVTETEHPRLVRAGPHGLRDHGLPGVPAGDHRTGVARGHVSGTRSNANA